MREYLICCVVGDLCLSMWGMCCSVAWFLDKPGVFSLRAIICECLNCPEAVICQNSDLLCLYISWEQLQSDKMTISWHSSVEFKVLFHPSWKECWVRTSHRLLLWGAVLIGLKSAVHGILPLCVYYVWDSYRNWCRTAAWGSCCINLSAVSFAMLNSTFPCSSEKAKAQRCGVQRKKKV